MPAAFFGGSVNNNNKACVNRPHQKEESGNWIEGSGVVRRLLSDDNDGDRHQRFIISLGAGRTLLVAHNIDIAERVPLGIGDRVRFRGLYEWNELGGLVHWTHRDPHGIEAGGFIRYGARTYQ